MLRISGLLVGSLLIGLVGTTANAGKRFQEVDWSEYMESPAEKARWEARAKSRPGEQDQAQADRSDERGERGGRKAKKVKKAKGGKKARKAAAAARKKRNR